MLFGVNTMPADALSRQSISRHGIICLGQKACIVVSELISLLLINLTWVGPNPRYDSKCEYIFYKRKRQNNSAWYELKPHMTPMWAAT